MLTFHLCLPHVIDRLLALHVYRRGTSVDSAGALFTEAPKLAGASEKEPLIEKSHLRVVSVCLRHNAVIAHDSQDPAYRFKISGDD